MAMRGEPQYTTERKKRVELLVREAIDGVTKRDTLPNDAYPFEGEAEAMYFQRTRDFMKTTIAHRIMDVEPDVYGGK